MRPRAFFRVAAIGVHVYVVVAVNRFADPDAWFTWFIVGLGLAAGLSMVRERVWKRLLRSISGILTLLLGVVLSMGTNTLGIWLTLAGTYLIADAVVGTRRYQSDP